MIQPVILWTDALIFLLVFLVIVFAMYASRYEHLRAPWREVIRSRMAVASLVILSVYTLVGLLDSLHFRKALPQHDGQQEEQYDGDVLSVLDEMLGVMRTQEEKTYSAPFATHLYTKDFVVSADGERVRTFPRLKYGGASLDDPATEAWPDIRSRD